MIVKEVTPEEIDKDVNTYFLKPEYWDDMKAVLQPGDELFDYDGLVAGVLLVRGGEVLYSEKRK